MKEFVESVEFDFRIHSKKLQVFKAIREMCNDNLLEFLKRIEKVEFLINTKEDSKDDEILKNNGIEF